MQQGGPSDPLVRAERLRRYTGPDRIDALDSALDDADLLVQGVAVLSLTTEEPGAVLRRLAPRLSGSGRGARAARRVALGLGARAAAERRVAELPVCEWAAADPDAGVRSHAAALCAARPAAGLETLQRLARDPDWTVRARLAAALHTRRDAPHAAVVLNTLARDVHRSVRRAALGPALS